MNPQMKSTQRKDSGDLHRHILTRNEKVAEAIASTKNQAKTPESILMRSYTLFVERFQVGAHRRVKYCRITMPNTKTTQTPARGQKSSQKRGKAPTTDQFCFLVASNLKITIEKEYQFHPERKWRFDYAIQEYKIAIEVEGGVWTGGRHTRSQGFLGDVEKYNAAAVLGWRLLRVVPTTLMSSNTLQMIQQCIENQKNLSVTV